MRRALPFAFALLAASTPVAAQVEYPSDQASLERSLRTCLTSGSAGAPRDSLTSAVIAVRSLCYTQIRRLREFRLAEVDKRFKQPETVLTPGEREEYERARDVAVRGLNDEIALAISNFTGLTL